jgi:mono/diheme cytochrome c family protein
VKISAKKFQLASASKFRFGICGVAMLVATALVAMNANSAPSAEAAMETPQDASAKAPQPKNSKWDFAPLAEAPEKARGERNPYESDAEARAAGAKLYDLHCGECHGKNGEGAKKGPALSVSEIQNAAPGALNWVITNGVVRRGMPVWSKLPPAQRWQIVTYLKSLK